MPNYFCLYPKGEDKPAILQEVDDKMREHFGQPPDANEYLAQWYSVIGCLIAVRGAALHTQQLRELILDWYTTGLYATLPDVAAHAGDYYDDMIRILDWLEEHYTSDNWASIGRIA